MPELTVEEQKLVDSINTMADVMAAISQNIENISWRMDDLVSELIEIKEKMK